MDEKLFERMKKVAAEFQAIIAEIESSKSPKERSARIGDIRQLAILTSVFQAGGEVGRDEISKFALRVGRTPGSVSGFYAGVDPLMSRAGVSRELRKLTERGEKRVRDHLDTWGENWLQNLFSDPLYEKVRDSSVSENVLVQIP